ncbi:MAG TPA: hypothetical protein VD695_08455 [Gaiellaceae bacterium]|nr:hypothetical protein [Gaiellaceae bacterium]
MRRILTWGLVAAVAALGLAAGIDALRGGAEPEPAATTTARETEPAERTLAVAGADLRRAGVPEGRLVYSDDDCGVHSLQLPSLVQRPVHDMAACQTGPASLGPVEAVRAECARGRLTLVIGLSSDPELYARGRGCGAAWKPDGTVTFVRDGEIRRFVRCRDDPPSAPLLCSEPVLTRVELARRLPEALWRHVFPRIKELRWLDDLRLAAVVQSRTPEEWVDFLVLFDRGRLVGEPAGPYAELGGLTASPTGRRVAAADTERGGVVAIDGAGRPIELALDDGHAIAWSPDEEWVAEATEGGIYVWRADDESPELMQIPVVARDLVWTAPPGDIETELAEARSALRAAGVSTGTLTYADEDCRIHELALPDLAEGGSPRGYAGLCRYRAVFGGLVETTGSPRSPDWRVEAACGGGMLRLWQREFGVDEPHLVARARGCGAAWKPDGTVTFVQDGEVRRFTRCPGDGQGTPLLCSEPVLTRAQLARQLPGGSWTVTELHWLDDTRFAAIVRDRGFDYLALFERGRVVRAPVYGFEGLEALKPSPQGRFVAAYERSGTIVVVGPAGKPVHVSIQRGDGIAWSRNEKWVAVATEGGIWLFRADGTGPAPVRIPIPARDVVWTEP